jgi:hypothetical protein
MQLTVNQLAHLIANSAPQSLRQSWVNASAKGNTKQQQAWFDFGWPEQLDFYMLNFMFERTGIADCIVTTPPDICWKTHPTIWEGRSAEEAQKRKAKTPFENAADELADRLSIYQLLKQADEKGRIGFYSALIIQVSGQGEEIDWSKPLGMIKPDQVVNAIPVYCEQLKPSTWDENRASLRYGRPETYNYQESAVGDKQDVIARTETIHHSRVIVFTEKPVSSSIRGRSALASSFNDLLMVQLIGGSGGQGFWKNSAGKLHFNITDPQAAPVQEQEKADMEQSLEDFTTELDKFLLTSGIDVNKLEAVLADPEPFYQMYLSNIAASSRIPKNRLSGSQTGVLAGDKDEAAFLSEMMSRRQNWCTQMVNQWIDWCIAHGALPKVRYVVEFDDLLSASDEQRLTLVDKMTQANDKHITAQVKIGATEISPLFSEEEIRLIAGFKGPVKQAVEQVEDEIIEPESERIE